MRWNYWISRYVDMYCLNMGKSVETQKTYRYCLQLFAQYMQEKKRAHDPTLVSPGDIFDFLDHLKNERANGAETIRKSAGVIRNFYQCLVSLDACDANRNPARNIKNIRGGKKKVRDVLTIEEAKRLIKQPKEDSVVGVRDKAIILLLYSTGIRASECAGLSEKDVNLEDGYIRVVGKGGDERQVPLNTETIKYLEKYKGVRGHLAANKKNFQTRMGTGITRQGIYDRIKKWVRVLRIRKKISPHNLRHTFATHAYKRGASLVTLKELLGHRCITSTMVYLRGTVEDLRKAISQHPVSMFSDILDRMLPDVRLPYQLSRSGFK